MGPHMTMIIMAIIVPKKRPMSVHRNKIHIWDVVLRVAITMAAINSLCYAAILTPTLILMPSIAHKR